MTIDEDEARINELAKLIESEKDSEKVVNLAVELERLLELRLERQKTAADKKESRAGLIH